MALRKKFTNFAARYGPQQRSIYMMGLSFIATLAAFIIIKNLIVPFTHVMHLAAQAGVRYAMQNPSSYVHTNKKKE
ncbi:UDP-glucuronate 4-epimerase, putative [Medicago truncatula]|uniref:UDP-glucuronate 4-epimerase, putative n=1 Tax=Medicago truncatula TaxID=3880 RepID=G7JK71_MEDTR|nr:UDP-glucuronate 4-epimerase, putative [Medicago truncatula]